ncbi:MAG: sporulation protein [Clostridia bacterium]|nr:sporulation protein [Clostridia bacterium]
MKAGALAACCLAVAALLLLAPSQSLAGARSGLELCAEVVIPSLFPFMCLSGFIIRSGLAHKAGRLFEPAMRLIFRLPGCTAIALGLGLIGGYPVGAAAAAELCSSGSITKRQAERLLCFCINSGPAFIIGAVGAGILRSTQAGILLYAAHIGASLIIGLLAGFFSKRSPSDKSGRAIVKRSPLPEAFVGSVTQAAQSMIAICAFVVLFASLISLLSFTGTLGGLASMLAQAIPAESAAFYRSLLIGFLEVTNGCAGAAAKGVNALLLLPVILSFSGLSVHCQVMAAVRRAGLSIRAFVATRVLHIIFALALTWLLFSLFPVALPTFATNTIPLTASVHSAPACVALLFMSAMLLLSQLRV